MLERSKADLVTRGDGRQQSWPGSSLRAALREAFIELSAYAHRPSIDRWWRPNQKGGSCGQIAGIPLLLATVASCGRSHGPLRLCWYLLGGREQVQRIERRGERLHPALALARDDTTKPDQGQATGTAIPIRRRRRHDAGQTTGHCCFHSGRRHLRRGTDRGNYQRVNPRSAGGAGRDHYSQCYYILRGGGGCCVVMAGATANHNGWKITKGAWKEIAS